MENRKVEFKDLCGRLIRLYQRSFDDTISIEDIVDQDKFKSVYRQLAKKYHPDGKNIDGGVMAEVNAIKDRMTVFLDDPRFISSFMQQTENILFDIDEYRRYVIGRLNAKREEYKDIWESFKEEVEDFETLILFQKSKESIDNLYYSFVNDLNKKLKKERYMQNKASSLRGFVDGRNKENVELFHKFLDEIRKCNTIGDAAELYKDYEIRIRKNAVSFLMQDSLSRLCGKSQDEQLRLYIEEAVSKVKLLEYNDEAGFMDIFNIYSDKINVRKKNLECYQVLDDLMKSYINVNYDGIYIGEVLSCTNVASAEITFKSLKERIDSRIDYSKRVSAKILGFLNKFKRNRKYSFTYPFIYEKASALFNYYDPMDKDLSSFDAVLTKLKLEVAKQCLIDQEKVSQKKYVLKGKFGADFAEGIFLRSGERFLKHDLKNITTFGGFADFENKTIRMQLPRVVADVYNYLVDIEEHLLDARNLDDKKDRLQLLKKAINLSQVFAKICKVTEDYSAIKINRNTVINYRTFSRSVQSLKNIDFLNDSIERIVDKFAVIEELLYGDDYDDDLEDLFNKGRRK